jgi:toxin ParE1/3/4
LRVKWLSLALLDLDVAEDYIAQDDPQAAVEIVLKIIRNVSLLQDQPGLGRVGRIPGTKELVIPNTPYIVPYRAKDNIVQILRVYHSSQKWPDRI